MRYLNGRSVAILVAVMVALGLTTPASAQFGGLKKRLKAEAVEKGVSKAAGQTDSAAPAGGTLVLTSDVVERLIAGLKAGRAERELAEKEDTPYGRYRRAQAAFDVAEPKCQQAQQAFPQKLAANEKLTDKYSALVNKMVDAQSRQDQATAAIYQDSAFAMTDPSCTVKRPQQPNDYYDAQRSIDDRAEKETMKQSGFNRSDLFMALERTEAILRGATPPGDASSTEKAAVSSHASELKSLLGIHDAPAAGRVGKAAAAAPAPAPAPCSGARSARGSGDVAPGCVDERLHDAEHPEARDGGPRPRRPRRDGQGRRQHGGGDGDCRHAAADPDGRLHGSALKVKTIVRAVAAVGTAAAIAISVMGASKFEASSSRPADALAVRDAGGWVTWWRRDAAPSRWTGRTPLASRVSWRPGSNGVEWGELQLRGASEAWRTRLVILRVDPRRVSLALAPAFTENRQWTVGDAGDDAAFALVAGQFRESLPWGWVVTGGRQLLAPVYAPLAGAVVVDAGGTVRVVSPDSVEAERARGNAREAFQSYPMLLENGAVPAPLVEAGKGVDLEHRDGRLALGTLPDGRVIIALTRFDALGETLGRVPFGLTSPEMAAVMGALGCRQALLLDGGISGQLLVRDAAGTPRVWPGTRRVPLGLVGRVVR